MRKACEERERERDHNPKITFQPSNGSLFKPLNRAICPVFTKVDKSKQLSCICCGKKFDFR